MSRIIRARAAAQWGVLGATLAAWAALSGALTAIAAESSKLHDALVGVGVHSPAVVFGVLLGTGITALLLHQAKRRGPWDDALQVGPAPWGDLTERDLGIKSSAKAILLSDRPTRDHAPHV